MTLHIALDGFYVNVNHIIVQKLVEYLTSKSYTVKTIFPLQDETVQHILNTYDLTLSEKALLTALDRSIIVVVQPLQENNQILDKFAKLTQQFDNVYPVNFVDGAVDLTFRETIETIFEVLPTCNWCGRLFTKTVHFKKYCSHNCKDYAKEEQNRLNFRNYYKRYKDTMSESKKGALGSRGANLHAHANDDPEIEPRLISNEKKRLGL